MKIEIEIWNGSGWNNYAALRNLKSLPVGTKGFAKENGVAKITVSPANPDKPFGIAACYYEADGGQLYKQGFDQNDTADWIRDRITALLTEGIANRIARNAAKADADAQSRGFKDRGDELQQAEAKRQKRADDEAARRTAILADTSLADAALAAMRAARLAHPEAVRITRKGDLVDAQEKHIAYLGYFAPLTPQDDWRDGLYAWLHQNGSHPGLDFREKLFLAGAPQH